MKNLFILLAIVVATTVMPASAYAQAYGEGAYNSGLYNGGTSTTSTPNPLVINTPVGNLPVTGQSLAIFGGAGLVLIVAGIFIFTRRRSHA
jgi:LPXTG-motif cell wall-anchored protein